MLKKADSRRDNMASCYWLPVGEFMSIFYDYFNELDEDVEVCLETPNEAIMSVLVCINSKYDNDILTLYNNYVNGDDFYVELDEFLIFEYSDLTLDFIQKLVDERVCFCKIKIGDLK